MLAEGSTAAEAFMAGADSMAADIAKRKPSRKQAHPDVPLRNV